MNLDDLRSWSQQKFVRAISSAPSGALTVKAPSTAFSHSVVPTVGSPSTFSGYLSLRGSHVCRWRDFNTPDSQPALIEVPLERIERGLRWMRAHPKVTARGDRIAVLGVFEGWRTVPACGRDLSGPRGTRGGIYAQFRRLGRNRLQPASWVDEVELEPCRRTTSLRALPRGRRSVVERARPERAADLRPRSRECGRGRSGGHSDRTRNGSSACHLWR